LSDKIRTAYTKYISCHLGSQYSLELFPEISDCHVSILSGIICELFCWPAWCARTWTRIGVWWTPLAHSRHTGL